MNNLRLPLLLCLLLPLVAGAESLHVQAKKAKLLSQPAFSAEVLGVAPRGESLEVLAEDGRWLRVRHGSLEGWVPRLLLSKEPPLAKTSVLEDEAVDLRQQARRRASASAGTAAARGLRQDARARSSQAIHSDYAALEEMEQMVVSEEEVEAFMAEGQE